MDPAHVIKDDNGEPAPEPPKPDPTGGRGFGALMQDAVKLKEEQMKSGKKKWDRVGEWRQHTLYHGETFEVIKNGRKLSSTSEQLEVAVTLKSEGGTQFKIKNLQGALDKYEHSLSLLWYFQPTDENWKKKGISDDIMELIDLREQTNDNELKKKITLVTSQVLTNIALIKLNQEKYSECIQVSTDALEILPSCFKAFYYRAKARLGSKSSGGTEYQMALKDLNSALNSTTIPKEVKLASSVRNNLQKTLKKQATKDKKQWSGTFDRGEVVKKNEKKPEQIQKEVTRKKEQQKLDFQKLSQMANG